MAEHALEERQDAGVVKQLSLPRMLFEDARECESLDGTLALVVGRGFDGDVRRQPGMLRLLDIEEALRLGGRGSEAQVDVEEGGGGLWLLHLVGGGGGGSEVDVDGSR